MKKLFLLKLCLPFFCSVVFISCNVTDSENKPAYSPDHKMPVVGGIYITGENDRSEIGVWGHPAGEGDWIIKEGGSSIYGTFDMDSPYPNPFSVSTSVPFKIPIKTHVRIYVVPARLQGAPVKETEVISGGCFSTPHGKAIKLLVDDDLNPGIYYVNLRFTNEIPAGFYRVYMEAGENLLWRDILLAWKASDLPPGLNVRIFW